MELDLAQVEKYLLWRKGKSYIANKLGVTLQEVEEAIAELKGKEEKEELNIDSESHQYNFEKGTYKFEAYYDHPPTADEIISDHQIDLKKYTLSAFYSKAKSKGWFVTALFKSVPQQEKELSGFQDFLKNYKSEHVPSKGITLNPKFESESCLVLSLCDFHLGKLDRNIVPLETRLHQYRETIDNLLYKAYHSHNLEEIVFVVGNDLFQTDTVLGTTVKFTKVGESERWDNIYEVGFDLMVETITKLKTFCKRLKIILVGGNHSESKEYYLTHALEVYFSKDSNISFNRSSDKYKCHVYGQTVLYFSHGDTINEKLPLMFAQSFSKEWGQTKYREIILGDKHHNSEKRFHSSQGEAQGVRMRILSSLTNEDQWHYDNLFTNSIQAGIALIYDKEKGKCSEFEHRI